MEQPRHSQQLSGVAARATLTKQIRVPEWFTRTLSVPALTITLFNFLAA